MISPVVPPSTFSRQQILNLRSEAFAEWRRLNATERVLVEHLESLDAGLRLSLDEHNIDSQRALTAAARNLSALLETAVGDV